MTLSEKLLLTIKSSLKECDSHLKWLKRGHNLLSDFFPLTAESILTISEDQVAALDQFIYRFMKLQDSMGTRLLPSIYHFLQGGGNPVPFLDILSGLEKLEVVSSENDWQFFRNLRNNLAHDYPESADQTVLTLNTLHSNWGKMETLYTVTKDYCVNRIVK